MKTVKDVYAALPPSLRQFVRFGIVGGSGVVVNMVVMILLKRNLPRFWLTAAYDGVWLTVPGAGVAIRWYHVMSTVAFFVANLWNFQLNRSWTFQSRKAAPWFKEYWPFLVVGLVAQFIGLGILTLLVDDRSPLALPRAIFDDTSGLRTRLYWAQLIMIMFTIPVSFLLNKFWTFRAVRQMRRDNGADITGDMSVDG